MLPHPFLLLDSASALVLVCHLDPDVGTIFRFHFNHPCAVTYIFLNRLYLGFNYSFVHVDFSFGL